MKILVNTDHKELLTKITDFCDKEKINYKFVNENLIIYPDCFSDIDKTKCNSSENIYVDFLQYTFDNAPWDEPEEDDDIKITFDVQMEYDFNFETFEDVAKELLKIKNKKFESLMLSQEELELREAKRLIEKVELSQRIEVEKIFNEKLKELRISREEFLSLLDLYKTI